MRAFILMENTSAAPEFQCEHGLSVYVETGRHKLLADTGQSGAFLHNAEKLGIDLTKVDTLILSHGHYSFLYRALYRREGRRTDEAGHGRAAKGHPCRDSA